MMRDFFWIVFTITATVGAAIAGNQLIDKWQEPSQFQYDIEVIRAAQRECLNREPAHSFSLVQTHGGYLINCEPLRSER
jgi:hypothetical protein